VTGDNTGLLEATDLRVVFGDGPSKIAALDQFNLRIESGEIVGLVGEPGSGKSIAAFALLGLVKNGGTIEAGQVNFRGRNLLTLPAAEQQQIRGKHIGLITQKSRGSLHPLLDVGTQIANVCRAHEGVGRSEAKARAVELLTGVGINDPERRLAAFPHELSTGMAQRVVIAMAMAGTPELLIADEPTSGLDVTIQAQLLDNLWDSAQANDSAVLLITQDLGIIANYCDRVFVIQRGTIVEQQPVKAFFAAPQHPYSQKILGLQQREEQHDVDAETSSNAEALLDVRELRKTFAIKRGRAVVQAVDRVSFDVRRSEAFGLVGESGSGKTTVGRTVLRLEAPTSGEILFDGNALHNLSATALRALRARMQIVFQDPMDSMDPRWTVKRIVREPLRLTDLTPTEADHRVAELLESVGLPASLQTARPQDLSAGQQQRIAIARAMATRPDFIVLDEPTSALTPETTLEILALLQRLQTETGSSYLFISHDLTTVRFLCHRVGVMYLGQIVELGTKQQVFDTPRHPYARALLAAHLYPDPTDRRVDRENRNTLSGEVPSPVDLPNGCYLYGRCSQQQDRCGREAQPLSVLDDGRSVRCWRVAEGEI
jgi:peptide/nickel transport system ATP-binding protein